VKSERLSLLAATATFTVVIIFIKVDENMEDENVNN
jgi:hypothetical protein